MKKIIFTIIVSSIFIACSKQPETNIGMLTENSWKMTAHTVSPPLSVGEGKYISDMLYDETACSREATFEFTSEGKYIKTDGCQSLAKEYSNWKFYKSETNIIIFDDFSTDTFEILELNNDKIRLKRSPYSYQSTYLITYESQ